MAKSILDELESILGKDAVSKIKSDGKLSDKVADMDRVYGFYTGDLDDTHDDAARLAAEKEASDRQRLTEKAEADRIAAERSRTVSSGSTAELTSVLNELKTLTTTINEFKEFQKNAITLDKLPTYEANILRKTHEISLITNNHEKEFSESLDLNKLDEWVTEQKKTGAGWPSITSAYDAWVNEKRIEARIQKGVAEGVKQKASSSAVPGQTHTASLSPAQQIM